MLRRALRSRLTSISPQSLQNSYSQLHLPWLCPSLYAANLQLRHTTTASPTKFAKTAHVPRPKPSRAAVALPSQVRRGLASATPAGYATTSDRYVPFEALPNLFGPGSTISSPFRRVDSHHHIPGIFDPQDSILLDDSVTTAPPTFKSFNAISGEITEIHQTLHACLQVGRLTRAVALMRRLDTLYKPDAPGLLAAHNDYIRELTYRLSRSEDQQMLKDIQKWFEVNLRGKGVTPDAMTFALMIKAASHEPEVKKVSRAIKRYVHLAEEAGILDETVAVASGLLDDENLDILREVRMIHKRPIYHFLISFRSSQNNMLSSTISYQISQAP